MGGTRPSASKPRLSPLRRRLILTDALMVVISVGIGLLVSARESAWAIDPLLAVYGTPVAIGVLWMALLGLRGSYDLRLVGVGTEEMRRVASATLYTFTVVAGLSYLIRADISRSYAFVSLPLGLLLIVASRHAWRTWLRNRRAHGLLQYRTVVVGSGELHQEFVEWLTQEPDAGYDVVGTWNAPEQNEVGNWLDGLDAVISSAGAEAIAVTPSATLTTDVVRQMAWRMEGRKIDVLIAPAMLDVVGPRLTVRPTGSLPLLHLDEAALTRPQRFAKRCLDLLLAGILVIVLSPVLLSCALAVRLSSPGPVLFRQTRIGRMGVPFTMLKFRTMTQDADDHRERLRIAHGHDDPMFKMDDDPRVTRSGRFLRRWSLDELPQLLNVLVGSMSLVGPRPHPLDDVDRYELEAFRRLALKPGMTGLWQVEGRSHLSWQEALQLDLLYVESWSMSADVVLLGRTLGAVVQRRGAW